MRTTTCLLEQGKVQEASTKNSRQPQHAKSGRNSLKCSEKSITTIYPIPNAHPLKHTYKQRYTGLEWWISVKFGILLTYILKFPWKSV